MSVCLWFSFLCSIKHFFKACSISISLYIFILHKFGSNQDKVAKTKNACCCVTFLKEKEPTARTTCISTNKQMSQIIVSAFVASMYMAMVSCVVMFSDTDIYETTIMMLIVGLIIFLISKYAINPFGFFTSPNSAATDVLFDSSDEEDNDKDDDKNNLKAKLRKLIATVEQNREKSPFKDKSTRCIKEQNIKVYRNTVAMIVKQWHSLSEIYAPLTSK